MWVSMPMLLNNSLNTDPDVSRELATGSHVTGSDPEVSIVIPCLNEADTLGGCIRTAQTALLTGGLDGEIVVADNGSTDASIAIAEELGARVVHATHKGYGSALMCGIAAARGKFVVMGDADGSYDFLEVPRFVEKLRKGADLVQGCRLPPGGGRVLPGAMPFSHRWVGNPLFSRLVQRMFGSPVHDVYCGLRGFAKDFYQSLDQRCTGMEFATEMIIKAGIRDANVAEIPITLHPDGRKTHRSHLNTYRDGWRTLRYFLLYCPRWLFWYPGIALLCLGVFGYVLALPGFTIGRMTFDAHTLLFASLGVLLGFQSMVFAVHARLFAIGEGLWPEDPRVDRLFRHVTLETGLIIGLVVMLCGIGLLLGSINQWRLADFGRLDYARTMRWVIPGATMAALGFQTMLSMFFSSILLMHRR
jgi:glycosyltransferase involved in cell wall biosynthesis